MIKRFLEAGISVRAIEVFPEYQELKIEVDECRLSRFAKYRENKKSVEICLEKQLENAIDTKDLEKIRILAVNPDLESYIWRIIPHIVEYPKTSKQTLFTSFIRTREQMRKIKHLDIYRLSDPFEFYFSLPEN
jgi:hypothetical protein